MLVYDEPLLKKLSANRLNPQNKIVQYRNVIKKSFRVLNNATF